METMFNCNTWMDNAEINEIQDQIRRDNSMINLVGRLMELVNNDVMVGVIHTAYGIQLRVEYKTPDGTVFKYVDVTTTTPGYSMSHYRLVQGNWNSEGHSHITKDGYLCETVWREFGGDIAKLIRFFDKYPELKQEVIG